MKENQLKSLIHKITGGLGKLSHWLLSFGPFGLLAIAFLDSVLVPIPGGVDAMLLLLAASRPSWMLIYVAAAMIGSTAGCVGLYKISERAGHRALNRFSEKKQKRVKDLIDRYDVLSVLVASVLPPPFPFKLFVVSAGVFRLNLVRFTIAIAVGRTFRYLLEGYLAAHYGEHAKEILAHYYPSIGIGVAVLIIVFFIAKNLLKRGSQPEPVSSVES
ncbi:MAG TPA: VTT domain-containing protein [Pyrinomonadaceae bacterium]|nr:VTT domain-containing protein [Pyrinomonadaceae bacterium]